MATIPVPPGCAPAGVTDKRALDAFAIRFAAAAQQARVPIPKHTTNGDEARYPDKCATYTKCLKQDGPGVVNPAAFKSFKDALNSGNPGDFEKIILGGPPNLGVKLNGPQGSYAFALG